VKLITSGHSNRGIVASKRRFRVIKLEKPVNGRRRYSKGESEGGSSVRVKCQVSMSRVKVSGQKICDNFVTP